MPTEIVMPQMGADMEEGTLLRWLKRPGDHVARGEPIAEIETDKANVEIEAFDEGILAETLVEEGEVVPVGRPIARLASPDEARPGRDAEPASSHAPIRANGAGAGPVAKQPTLTAINGSTETVRLPHASEPDSEPVRVTAQSGADVGRIRISPVARHMAEELGIDVCTLRGSGPDGRIMRKDVEAVAATRAPRVQDGATAPRRWTEETPAVAEAVVPTVSPERAHPAAASVSETLSPAALEPRTPVELPASRSAVASVEPAAMAELPTISSFELAAAAAVEPLSRMRQAIARRMAQSKREAPHYYVTIEVDMTEAMAFRDALNRAGGESVHITVNDLIVKTCAELLRRYPRFNASLVEGSGLRLNERVNLCIAIALPEGLIAPALLDVGARSLGAIARGSRDLAERARSSGLRPAELNDGTFTVSNLGMYGIETLIPIIQPPQSAILGVGAVQEKPAVRDGQIVIRKLLTAALAADHRVTDGAEGAQFLSELKTLLETPVSLAL